MPRFVHIGCATISLLFGCIIESGAQNNRREFESGKLTLRINPFSFVELDGNLSIGVGYQWHPRWAITVDPGWIFFSPYSNANGMASISGIKIRSDVRFLFDRLTSGRFASFIAPEFHFKNVTTTKEDDFGINCLGGQCDYYQRAEYKEAKREIGGGVKIGTQIVWTGRLKLELYGGLGIKFLKFNLLDIPPGGSFVRPPDEGPISNTNRRSTQLLVPAGIKIIFSL